MSQAQPNQRSQDTARTPPDPSASNVSAPHMPAAALALGTLLWGLAFNWAKAAGDDLNRLSGAGAGAAVGPILLLAWRFALAGVLWFVLFPRARRNWSIGSLRKTAGVGALLAAALVLQHLGLDRTSEAVSAFLTSLTILFVPLVMTIVLRQPPRAVLWVAVGVAVLGIWLMTGATPAGFGVGEWLGLACALAFSIYILAINSAVASDDPWRVAGGQFVVVGVATFIAAWLVAPAPRTLMLVWHEQAWGHLLLLTVFPTIIAFGLLTFFQPRIDPTRAALIYLLEPVFAAGFARIVAGRELGAMALLGAGLILLANALVELFGNRRSSPKQPVPVHRPEDG
jgi:drug/metabolite transporter (DMT)-like permease